MKRLMGLLVLVLLATPGFTGCDYTDLEDPESQDKADQMNNLALNLLDGYDDALKLGRQSCMDISDRGQLSYNVGTVSDSLTIKLISSNSELSRQFGLKIGGEIGIGPVGIGLNFGLNNEYKKSATSTYLLITQKRSYRVDLTNAMSLRLAQGAVDLLQQNQIGPFMAKCGTQYITGVEYDATFHLLIRVTTDSVAKTNGINAGLSAKGISVAPITLSANISGGLTTILNDSGVTTELSTAANGFMVPGDLLKAFQKPFDAETIKSLGTVGEQMRASITLDWCHDTGHGKCSDGQDAIGYFNKVTMRKAIAGEIFLKDYLQVSNAPIPSAGSNPYLQMAKTAKEVSKYVKKYQSLIEKISTAYTEEILPVAQSATPYNYYPYFNSRLAGISLPQLKEQAQRWAARFNPETGEVAGPLMEELQQCSLAARYGSYEDCMGNPEAAAAYQQAESAIQQYLTQERIGTLTYTPTAQITNYYSASSSCTGQSNRLPTLSEAKQLNLVIQHNTSLPRNTSRRNSTGFFTTDTRDWSNAIWFSDPSACNNGSAALRVLAGNTFDVVCENLGSLQLTTLCVPQGGVFLTTP